MAGVAGAQPAFSQPIGYRHELTLNRSYVVDLETGGIGSPQADLEWNETREGTFLRALGAAYFVNIPSRRIPAGRGTRVDVRTAEGNTAELRILSVDKNSAARLEWTLYLKR